MARTSVFSSYEVREGFGSDTGEVVVETPSREEADAELEQMWALGSSVQLFGVKTEEGHSAVRVLLRSLVGLKAA